MSIPIKLNPLGINKKNDYRTPLTLTALEDNSSVQLVCVTNEGYSGSSSVDFSKMYYRTNESNTWLKYNNEVVNLYNEGDYVQFVNSNNILSISNLCFANFVMTGKIAGSGNVQSLLNFQKYVYSYSFYGLFSGCTSLIYSPSFPGKFPNGHSNQYFDTFYGCTNLLEAPDLMTEDIHGQTYCRMFYNCKSLQYPPKMPKTITITNSLRHCYQMFYGCSSLRETPEFECSGTAYNGCFQSMFEGCTSLKVCKIKLSSTTLGPSCYRGMFYNCKLDEIPELPATTLSNECYMRMFCGCDIEEVTLPATVLADYCYYEMFYNCKMLHRVYVSFTNWENFSHSTTNWLVGTRPNGRFYKPDTLTEEYGDDRIPESWWLSEPPSQPLDALTINALKDSTVKIIVSDGTPTISGLRYRRDVSNSWSTYTIDDELSIEKGKYIQFMNTENTLNSSGNTARFVITGVVSISGDIMSMLNYSSQCNNYCFNYLFYNNQSLYSCKDIILSPAAASNCYASLFSACYYMYEAMESLPCPPENIACYQYIFNNCLRLEEMPILPENFTDWSYIGAFSGCGTGLPYGMKTVPLHGEIKGKSGCYCQMFQGAKINIIEVDFTEWDSNSNAFYNTTGNWFLYVNERNYDGTFIKSPELNTEYGDSRIPTGWRIIESSPLTLTAEQSNSTVKLVSTGNPVVKKLQYRTNSNLIWKKYNINTVITLENVGDYVQFWNECEQLSLSVTDYVRFSMTGKISGSGNVQSLLDFSNNTSNYCFFGLFSGCFSLISAPELPSTVMSSRCYEEMFGSCTSLVSAPELPSTILAGNCYQDMFRNCTSLINVPELPAVTLFISCYLGMFKNCTSLINPPKLPSTSPAYYCYYEMFNNNESIQKIDVDFEYWLDNLSTNNWVKDVYQDGVFLKPENLPEEYGYSRIPVNFKPFDKNKPLTLTAAENGSTVKIIPFGSPSSLHLSYRKNNGEWSSYALYTVINLDEDDFVQFKNTTTEKFSTGKNDYYGFVMTGKIKASGNVQSLLNFSDTAEWYSFRKLFQNCKSLIEAPTVLPAKHVKGWTYASMFGKTSITNMPIMLAEDFGTDACYYMFEECPITYAKLLDKKGENGAGCFERMFHNCQNLKVIDVDFTAWDTVDGNNEQKYWCSDTPNNITFLKKRELNKMFSDNGIHSGWNVYNPLKFIQANGTQYVDTNITPSGNFEVEVYCTGVLNFGCCTDTFQDEFRFSMNVNQIDFAFGHDLYSYSKTGIGNEKNIIRYGTDGKFYVNNELVYSSQSSVSQYYPLYAFALNSNGVPIFNEAYPSKIFRIKMWRDGILVSDIVPVDADGEHLFDRLNNICLTNEYLPQGINKKIQYLESTGTQYIDTGVKPDLAGGDRIEVKFYKELSDSEVPTRICLFGCRQSFSTNGFYALGSAIVYSDDNGYVVNSFSELGTFTFTADDQYIKFGNRIIEMTKRVTCTNNMLLFALNDGGTPFGYYPDMRLYDWKYWHNGVLAQHLIPVIDNNNVPCMYDKVTKQLFYNQGTGNFLYGEKPYKCELDYIESTGTQYINTGIAPDFVNGDSIEISFFGVYMESGAKSVFGSRNMSSAKVVNGLYINGANIVFGDSEDYTTIPFDYRNEHILTINNTEITDNGTTFAQTPRHISCDYPIYLFTLNDRNFQTIGNYDGMKLYYWKYYRNGVLAQHLIPVLDNNNVPCLYDTITGNYYYNAGTGDFAI